MVNPRVFAFCLLFAAWPRMAWAHGDTHGATPQTAVKAEQRAFGIAGDPRRASRTVTIDMSDQMRFVPSRLEVKRGDTVRFVLHNKGKVLHEMVIGTVEELQVHAALMKKFPNMEHEAPYMAHVKPGKSEEIVWHFNRRGDFDFACLIPGHFEAGMLGKIVVK